MALDRENLLQEQEKLKLLNRQLQNISVQMEGNPGNNKSRDLCTLDELIQKRFR